MAYTALYGNGDAKLRDKNGNPIIGWCVRNGRQDQTSWVDFNGDGKIDMICDNIDGGHDLYLSRGTYVSNVNDASGSTRVAGPGWCVRINGRIDTTSWSDLNSDGKKDIICNNVDGGRDYYLSTGTNMRPAYAQEINLLNFSYTIGQPALLPNDEVLNLDPNVLCSKDNSAIHQIRLIDFNGDGKKDLVCDAVDGSHYVYLGDTQPSVSATICSSTQTCLDSGLNSYDSSIQQVIGINQPFGGAGQVCVDPDSVFNNTTQAIYNTASQKSVPIDATACSSTQTCLDSGLSSYNSATQKVVAINATICDSTQLCPPRSDDNTPPVTENNHDSAIDWTSFAFGATAGGLGIIALAGISYAIYKNCHFSCLTTLVAGMNAQSEQLKAQQFQNPPPYAPGYELKELVEQPGLIHIHEGL